MRATYFHTYRGGPEGGYLRTSDAAIFIERELLTGWGAVMLDDKALICNTKDEVGLKLVDAEVGDMIGDDDCYNGARDKRK